MHLSSFALSLSWQFLNCQTHSRKRGKQLRYWCAQKRAATCCDYVPLSTILRFTFRSISRTFYGSKIFLDAGLEETSHACTLNLGRYIRKSYTGSRNDAVLCSKWLQFPSASFWVRKYRENGEKSQEENSWGGHPRRNSTGKRPLSHFAASVAEKFYSHFVPFPPFSCLPVKNPIIG